MKAYCYILNPDVNHSGDPEADAFCLPFKGRDDIGANMIGIRDVELPSKLFFTANFEVIPKYDYPVTDLTVPVMSKRMLQIFTKIRTFKHIIVPVVMIDDSYLDDQFDKYGKLRPDVPFNDNYVALQIKEFTNAFNYEKSEYKLDSLFPGNVVELKKLILKIPEGGVPPIFKIRESREYLFVSQAAKDALEAAGIVGCVFEPVEVAD